MMAKESIKPVLIKLDEKLFKKVERIALGEKRKPGPMIVILLERYLTNDR